MSCSVDLCRFDQYLWHLTEEVIKDQYKYLCFQPLSQQSRNNKGFDGIDQSCFGIKYISRHHCCLRRQNKGKDQQSKQYFLSLKIISGKSISHDRTDHYVDQCRNPCDQHRILKCFPVIHGFQCLPVVLYIELTGNPVDRSIQQVIQIHEALAHHIQDRIQIDEANADQQQIYYCQFTGSLCILGTKDKFLELITHLLPLLGSNSPDLMRIFCSACVCSAHSVVHGVHLSS